MLRPRDLLNLSGLLTLSRVPLAVITAHFMHDRDAMLAILLAAALTDALDGPVARWRGTASRIGAVVDGWVDKIFFINYAWSMIMGGYITAPYMWIWFGREIVQGITVPLLQMRYALGDAPWPEPSRAGKAATVFIAAAMIAALLGQRLVLDVCTALGGGLGLWAAFLYLRRDHPFGAG